MTKEEVIKHFRECCAEIDTTVHDRDVMRELIEEYDVKITVASRRRYAWQSIYLNLFDEEMPELEEFPINGNPPLTVGDVIKIKEES